MNRCRDVGEAQLVDHQRIEAHQCQPPRLPHAERRTRRRLVHRERRKRPGLPRWVADHCDVNVVAGAYEAAYQTVIRAGSRQRQRASAA